MSMVLPTEIASVQGIFFPQYKKYVFHRINIEYIAPLKNLDWQATYTLLDKGLQHNLQLSSSINDEVVASIRPQLEHQSWLIASQGLNLRHEREQLRLQLQQSARHNFTLYRSNMELEFAKQQLSESLFAESSQAFQQSTLAEHALREVLKVDANNYRAHFELGWIYRSLLVRLDAAEFHFGRAASLAQTINPLFAQFALRHLADVRYGQQRHQEAIEASLAAIHSHQSHDLEHRYELARYLVSGGDVAEATRQLVSIVSNSPEYYVQAQVEPDFTNQPEVMTMLDELRRQQLTHIQHYVRKSWQHHPLAQLQLPDNIKPQQFFNYTLQRHSRVMAQLPFPTLANRQQEIGDLVIASSCRHISQEIRRRSRHYEKTIERKNQHWRWVNQIGAACLHGSAILLLACVLFFVLRALANAAGMSGLLSSDAYIVYALSALVVLLILGLSLVQFIPFGSKKQLRKQIELDDALPLLHNLP